MAVSLEKLYQTVLSLLSNDESGELKGLFKRILEWEKNNPPKNEYDGFYWHMVSGDPRVLNKLVVMQVLKVVLRTNSGTAYRLVNLETVEKALKDAEKLTVKPEEVTVEVPSDILDLVIGHEEKKEIILRALKSKERCHLLLYGSPSSAKSLILECLSRLPGSKYILGSSATKAGLFELLYNEEPSFLILDEIDKIQSMEDLSILLSLMERGFISEVKYGRRRSKTLNTKVIGACNRIDRLPPELLSRFIKLRFRDYSDDEFIDVSAKVLQQREGVPMGLAVYIADQVLRRLKTRDVRDSIKVARLLKEKSREDVDRVIELLAKQT
ncbi:MAG: AAA family ATPase [Nitrososphaerota archaeon]